MQHVTDRAGDGEWGGAAGAAAPRGKPQKQGKGGAGRLGSAGAAVAGRWCDLARKWAVVGGLDVRDGAGRWCSGSHRGVLRRTLGSEWAWQSVFASSVTEKSSFLSFLLAWPSFLP